MNLHKETQNWLGSTNVSKVLGPETRTLIRIDEKASIDAALEKMSQHQILSVPVMKGDLLRGFVDIYDILSYTTFYNPGVVDWQKPASELLGTMGSSMDDDVNAEWVIQDSSRLHKPLEWLSKGARRILVETNAGWKLLSQSDMVRFLWKNFDKFKIGDITVAEAKLGSIPVIRACTGTPALDCFKRMRIHEVHGIAITDSCTGKLVANLSESDLRGLTHSSLNRLQLEIMDFVKFQNLGEVPDVVTVQPNMKLRDIMETIIKQRKHRVFVVEGSGQLSGIITLTDIITYFWNLSMGYWFSTE